MRSPNKESLFVMLLEVVKILVSIIFVLIEIYKISNQIRPLI